MENQSVVSIETVIDFIENHLDGKLDLDTVAAAVHYSKYTTCIECLRIQLA